MAQVTRLFDLLPNFTLKYPGKVALASKQNKQWVTYTGEDFAKYANLVSGALINMGIQPGEKIGLISNNRPEWNFIDMGILQIGAINVPIYPTISENDLLFILKDAGIKYVFVSSEDLYQKVQKVTTEITDFKQIITFNPVPGAVHFDQFLKNADLASYTDELAKRMAGIKSMDLATILYTSGTTGNPKGVMLAHNNLVSNFLACRNLPPVKAGEKALSFLPLNHVYERMLTYLYMYTGVGIYYAESIETIGDNLKEVKPEVFSAVPRLLEKVYDKIVAKGHEQTGIKKKLFFWALELGLKYEQNGSNGWWYEFQLGIARKLIFSKWKEALGGNARAIVSGGAALQPRLARVFWAAGIHVLEGYGLTETSPVIAVNNLEPQGAKIGTVGPVIEGVQVKIAEDGEILVKGPNVMMGYYNRPDLTAEIITDGWFHTGDIGQMVDGRYLKITDRKKEIFKTSGGKYIAPQMIENKLKESPFIEQALVIGENQKYASAFIVPAFAYIKEWSNRQGIKLATNEDVIQNQKVLDAIDKAVKKVNEGLAQYETIKKFELLPREWSIEKGEMTPKLSLKRKVILESNQKIVEKLYNEN